MSMQEHGKQVLQAMTDESGKLHQQLDSANKELNRLNTSCRNLQQVVLIHNIGQNHMGLSADPC